MSGANRGGISIKTKIFAVLAVAVIMAAAFVGVTSIQGSNDSDAVNATVINEASSGVDYIPGTINISVGGVVIFTPTVTWVEGTYDGRTIVTSIVCVSSDAGVHFAVSDNNETVTVNAASAGSGSFTVTVTGIITAADGTVIAERATPSEIVNVNVYEDISTDDATVIADTCYFGESYGGTGGFDVSDLLSGGSGEYAISAEGLPAGLGMLGNTIEGRAQWSAFSTTSVTSNITVVDKKTGTAYAFDLSIPMVCVVVSGEITDLADGSDVTEISLGGTVYLNQSATDATATFTFKNLTSDYQLTDISYICDGVAYDATLTGDTVTFDVPVTVSGTHAYVLNYTVGGYSYTYSFYVHVINDVNFIVPTPSITITVTG